MRLMKKTTFFTFFIMFVFLSLVSRETLQLRIPLRFAEDTGQETPLVKENLTLTINGQEREISDLIKRERVMNKFPGLGRNFILSFHMTEYSIQVEKGIAFFITEIIHPSDSVIVVSPSTIYQINVSGNKEKMIRDIKQLLEKDCQRYKKTRAAVEKDLRLKIKNLRRILREGKVNEDAAERREISSHQYGVSQILAATQFLETFPREFIKFRELSLLLDTSKYRKIADILGFREGERWWLHFHQEDVTALLSYIRGFMKEFAAYVNNFERSQVKKFDDLEKVLSISNSFPVEPVLDTIVGGNFCYNVVFFGGLRISDREAEETETSGLARILHRIAAGSGGRLVSTVNVEEGVKEVTRQKDSHYELIFPFNGKVEKKDVKVTVNDKGIKLLYKTGFEKKELEALIHYLTYEKVRIADFSNKKNVIKFTIKSFKHHKEKKFGMLRVNIELFSQQGEVVYRTHNTLRSSQNEVTIRIPLPKKYSGNFKIRITANDLLANRRVFIERDITVVE